MSDRLQELSRRRQALVARATEEREALRVQGRALAAPGRMADRVLAAASVLKSHPLVLAGAAAALPLLVLRPRGITRWAGRAWMAWRALRALRDGLRPRAPG